MSTATPTPWQRWERPFWSAVLVVWGIVSRLPYVTDFDSMGKDGPEYVNSLALDASYNVPPPGNIGFVVLGRIANQVWSNPVHAYAAVTISVTCAALVFVFLLGARFLPPALAAVAAFAFSCDAIVWYHGTPIMSYPVWMIAFPAIAYFGTRFMDHGRWGDLVGASLALGLGSVVRNDVLPWAGPLWAGCLLLGRARIVQWIAGGAVVGVCVLAWFTATAAVLGGADVLIDLVRHKREVIDETFGVKGQGLVEGLARNAVKYGLWVGWSAHLALIPFAYCLWRYLRSWREHWRALAVAALWLGPSWYFAFFMAAFAPCQVTVFTMLVYLGAIRGLAMLAPRRPLVPALGGLAIAFVCLAQFTLTPLLPHTDTRNVIINVMLLRRSGLGIQADYNYNLINFGMDSSLRAVVRDLKDPKPVPKIPPARVHGKNEPLVKEWGEGAGESAP